MSKIEFELDIQGVRKEILQADWMNDFIAKEAKKICPSDKHIKSFIGYDRAKTVFYKNTKEHSE